jgi:symplekin
MDVSAFRDASTLLNTFISYFANSPDDLHADACLAWSHSLLALPLESATLHSLYDSVFDSLFTLLHAKIEQKDSVSAASLYLLRLASELPRLTSAMMHVVERCAYLPDREEKTISSLAAHVLYRQPVRQHALDMLMRLSVCDLLSKLSQDGGETESPSPVNEVLTQKHAIVALVRLSRDARFASSISSFATESLLSLRQMVGAQTAPNPEDSQAAPVSSSDASNSTSNVDIVDVQVRRKCLLFFALAARQKDMIVMLFAEFPKMPKPAQTALMTHVSDLFRALGPRSATLIEALKQAPSAAGDLVVHCINSIAALPAPDGNTVLFLGPLATVVRDAVASKTFDARALVPLLGHPAIPKTLVLDTLPSLLCLGAAVVTTVIQRLVSSPEAGISPAELLVRGHTASIANVADASIPERVFTVRQIEFINTCLAQRTFFTEMVIATALQQMASFQQIPMLFMRTLMQAVTIYPTMVDTCVNVMSRLVEKQIWTVPQLWQGFLKCVDMCKPKSADVLLRLPAAQFRDALSENPSLKELLRRTVRPNQLGPAQRQALFDEGR